jgi:ABC-type Fe3+-siderophore transport system permease subunit
VSATSSGAGAGVVLGIVFVLLAQQFGYLALNDIVTSLVYLIVAGVIGGVIFALIGWALGKRYERRHPEMMDAPPSAASPPQTP